MDFNFTKPNIPTTTEQLLEQMQPNGYTRPVQYKFKVDTDFNKAVWEFIQLAQKRVKNGAYDPKPLREPIISIVDWLFQAGRRTDIDYSKGLLLKGAVGRGKNVLLNTLAEMIELYEFKQERVKDGRKTIVTATPHIRESIHFAMDYANDAGGIKALQLQGMFPSLIIHDLGKEDYRTNYYGNSLNVVEYLIDIREANGLLTFATTNFNHLSCDPKTGGRSAEYAGYDDRTISRMHSLFNVINLNHDIDFRKI